MKSCSPPKIEVLAPRSGKLVGGGRGPGAFADSAGDEPVHYGRVTDESRQEEGEKHRFSPRGEE